MNWTWHEPNFVRWMWSVHDMKHRHNCASETLPDSWEDPRISALCKHPLNLHQAPCHQPGPSVYHSAARYSQTPANSREHVVQNAQLGPAGPSWSKGQNWTPSSDGFQPGIWCPALFLPNTHCKWLLKFGTRESFSHVQEVQQLQSWKGLKAFNFMQMTMALEVLVSDHLPLSQVLEIKHINIDRYLIYKFICVYIYILYI